MIKYKLTARATCDDCGAKRKAQAKEGQTCSHIEAELVKDGWHIGKDACYCPTCAEARIERGDAS